MAKAKSGPQNCEPLLYVCFSRYNSKASQAGDLAETARILLRHGADPNGFFTPDDLPNNPLSCLYAATGLNNNPALGVALLEAGANPNYSESRYHSTEHRDLACVRALLRHGATPTGTNALKHMLDREDIEGLKLLLASAQIRTRSMIAARQPFTGPFGAGAARRRLLPFWIVAQT